jgi:hypothetical protein
VLGSLPGRNDAAWRNASSFVNDLFWPSATMPRIASQVLLSADPERPILVEIQAFMSILKALTLDTPTSG